LRLSGARFTGFKRFTDLTIAGIPATAKLVVLAGPNGSGKSSIFDGFRTWQAARGAAFAWDESYGSKAGSPAIAWSQHVEMTFHGVPPAGGDQIKKSIYIRTAFRNEADFNVANLARLPSPLERPKVSRLIDNDLSVSDNYQRMVMQTLDGIYAPGLPDSMTRGELRDRIIGGVRSAMHQVFPDLLLSGVGGSWVEAGAVGTFYFDKGTSHGFLFKNLSGGEKAAFDLLLDVIVKREYFDDTLWCIDEPETHLNTRVQGTLLQALVELLPDSCQLFIASHSIGFMRKAWELAKGRPGEVCFLDMQDVDFDLPAVLTPIQPSRGFWSRTLDVALGDLASLVAPEHLVLCEGRPAYGGDERRSEFDAACYRTIFAAEFPNTDFLSVGNADAAGRDQLELGRAFNALTSGTRVTRVIDRDMRNPAEVAATKATGTRVLTRRHLEAYLLDDQVITALCASVEQADRTAEALAIKGRRSRQVLREATTLTT
jgi:hypothetical protein